MLLLSAGISGFAQVPRRTSFSKEEILERSITWLAEENNRDRLNVYKLSCPNCIHELKEALANDPENVGPISFSTFKKEDRPLAQALLATSLSQGEEAKRAEVFGELLGIFANDAIQFLTHPDEWRTLCLSYWDENTVTPDNPKPWADALNWMDQQNRMNILLDLVSFPGSLELQGDNPIPSIPKNTYRDQYLFVALSLPWLKYPPVHPVKGEPQAANHPENLPTVLVHPLQPLAPAAWHEHAITAEAGVFWNFVGESEAIFHPRMLEFLAAFLDLPTDEARREAFVRAIHTIGGDAGDRPKSILAAYPRVKRELPAAAPDRLEERKAEARAM
ncbi:MAG: hypothetical protein KJT03_22300, partial [Verrucomicrobiae bacterium]|nr:hypothetical protein [Verrucomicrobiae bacterium]